MTLLLSQVLPELKAFIAEQIKAQPDRECHNSTELDTLIKHHFPDSSPVEWRVENFANLPTREPYFEGSFSILGVQSSIVYINIPQNFQRLDPGIRIENGSLLLNFKTLPHYVDTTGIPSCLTSLNDAVKKFKVEVELKEGPVVEIPLPKQVKLLQIAVLDFERLGFIDEAEKTERLICETTFCQDVTDITVEKDPEEAYY